MNETELLKAHERLEANGYRLTPQRALILEVLLSQPNKHLSADDIYSSLKTDHPDLGIATVYRTLELFRELGIVHQMDFSEGLSRYEYGDWQHHHHLVCLKCGSITEFSDKALEEVELKLAGEYGFQVIGHHMKIFGYCKGCSTAAHGSEHSIHP